MADVKISALPAATTPLAGTEVLPIVQSATTDQVSVANLTAGRAVSAASLTLTTTPLAVGSGGTGLNTLASGRIPYGAGTSAFGNSANFSYNGTNLNITVADTAEAQRWKGATGMLRLRPYVDATQGSVFDATNSAENAYQPIKIIGSTLSLLGNNGSGISVTSAGLVGIGTTAPTSLLTIGTGGYTAPAAGTAGLYYSSSLGLVTLSDKYYFGDTSGNIFARIDTAGNFGLGLTPSAGWSGLSTAVLQGQYWSIWQSASSASFGQNVYYNGGFKYLGSSQASYYSQASGQHQWYNAPSGTANAAITFTQAMTLTAAGYLGVGTTAPGQGWTGGSANVIELNVGTTGGTPIIRLRDIAGGTTADSYILSNTIGMTMGPVNSFPLLFMTNSTERARIDTTGNVVINTAAIATTATDGFLYVPTCAGTPTGTPTTYTGRAPIVVNTTNNKLYFYSGGAWRDAGP